MDTNKPGAYETTLAYQFELPGTWKVSLIDITYPHTWLDLDKECVIGISTVFNNPNNLDNKDIIGEANSMELVKALKYLASYLQRSNELEPFWNQSRWRNTKLISINFKVQRTFGIVQGKYKLNKIFIKLQSKICSIGEGLDQTIVTYDKELNRVVIQQNQKQLLISSYT